MNDEDVREIKTTWKIPMENPNGSGQAILIEFFTQFPSNQQYFDDFKDVPVGELKDNAKFKAHAGRIIKLFDECINALGTDYADSTVQTLWKRTANSHHKKHISKESFGQLRNIILQVLTAVCNLNEAQLVAWNKLLDRGYEIVFKAYDELNAN